VHRQLLSARFAAQVVRGAIETTTREMHTLAGASQVLVDWQSLNAAFSVPPYEGARRGLLDFALLQA
jgi:hypothetical protein